MSGPNFDPVKLSTDVANLCKEVADIQAMITGKEGFKISEVVEAVDALAEVAGNFVPRIAALENMVAPLVPLIPLLEKLLAGESAGIGATQTAGVVIPAEEIGTFSDGEAVALESREPVAEMNPAPGPGEAVQEQNSDKPQGTA